MVNKDEYTTTVERNTREFQSNFGALPCALYRTAAPRGTLRRRMSPYQV